MYALGDDGAPLDAEYSVERDGDRLALVLASRSGGDRPKANKDYNPALRVLLERLRRLGGVVSDALVDSRDTQRRGLSEDERRLLHAPILLADYSDMETVRLMLTSRQGRVGKSPGSKDGTNTKRMRVRLDVPGFGTMDAQRLETFLALPVTGANFPTDAEAVGMDVDDLQSNALAEIDTDDIIGSDTDIPDMDYDERRRIRGEYAVRDGQYWFRSALIAAYGGRCAITRCPVTPVLEAAHLRPYGGRRSNVVTNGLLLRRDIHWLLDHALLAPDPATRTIAISKQLVGSEYEAYAGGRLAEPTSAPYRPAEQALATVWNNFREAERER